MPLFFVGKERDKKKGDIFVDENVHPKRDQQKRFDFVRDVPFVLLRFNSLSSSWPR